MVLLNALKTSFPNYVLTRRYAVQHETYNFLPELDMFWLFYRAQLENSDAKPFYILITVKQQSKPDCDSWVVVFGCCQATVNQSWSYSPLNFNFDCGSFSHEYLIW